MTSRDLGLYCPYSLMILGMNSNKTQDAMAGGLPAFFLSCAAFTAVCFLLAQLFLTKRDIKG